MFGYFISLSLAIIWIVFLMTYIKQNKSIRMFGYVLDTTSRWRLITLQTCLALVGLIIITSVFAAVDLNYSFKSYESGSVKTKEPLSAFGFGPTKRLLVFEFDVREIDISDKIFAKMSYGENGTLVDQTVGIEIKGSGLNERPKLNYAFEIWEPDDDDVPCTSPETCDDDKAELFDWGEKYEDWVLRGGFKEPTLIRDAVAAKMADLRERVMESKLVEVLFYHDGEYSYEGVYLLFPAIQRRLLEKRLDLTKDGKKEDCEDSPTVDQIKDTLLIGEYTNPSKGRKNPCMEKGIDGLKVKMRYPKCDIGECYHDRIKEIFSVLTMQNTSVVPLNLESFMYTFFTETLLMNGDFPVSSQYFFLNPDTQILNSGPRWDYDYMSWRTHPHNTWDFHITYSTDPAKLWEALGSNKEFVSLLNLNRENITFQNKQIMLSVIQERRDQFKKGYFDRNIERWRGYDSRVVSYLEDAHLMRSKVKRTWSAELDFIEERLLERAEWMMSNPVVHFEFFAGQYYVLNSLLYFSEYAIFIWSTCILLLASLTLLCKYGLPKIRKYSIV